MLFRSFVLGVVVAFCCCVESWQGFAQPASALNLHAERASCLIEANSVIKLSSSTQGTLSKVEVKRGDRVEAGQIVAQLDSEVERILYEAARTKAQSDVLVHAREADFVNADRKLTRTRQLANKEYASMQALDDAQTAADLAKFAIEQAKLDQKLASVEADRLNAVIERRMVRSPINGVVTKLDLRAGEYADPANPIVTIAEIRPLLVEVYMPVEAYPYLRVGMRARIKPHNPIGGNYVAEIVTKDPTIDSASGMFQLSLKLPNQDEAVPAGIRCSIEFLE